MKVEGIECFDLFFVIDKFYCYEHNGKVFCAGKEELNSGNGDEMKQVVYKGEIAYKGDTFMFMAGRDEIISL